MAIEHIEQFGKGEIRIMEKEERRQYILAQLGNLPNATQYVEVTKYIEDLEQQVQKQKEVIDKAIEFYENNEQECVIGRTGEGKLRKDYYLPAHLSKTLINILKEVSE